MLNRIADAGTNRDIRRRNAALEAETGKPTLIEVKTTKYGAETPFFVTRNEVSTSGRRSTLYFVYRLYGFRQTPKLYTLPGAISQSCQLSAASFLAMPR